MVYVLQFMSNPQKNVEREGVHCIGVRALRASVFSRIWIIRESFRQIQYSLAHKKMDRQRDGRT